MSVPNRLITLVLHVHQKNHREIVFLLCNKRIVKDTSSVSEFVLYSADFVDSILALEILVTQLVTRIIFFAELPKQLLVTH